MGLSLGGVDSEYNIVPQSNMWQRTGSWRDLEKVVYNFAMEVYNWTTEDIVSVGEASNIKEPILKVDFFVKLFNYDNSTCEPLKYKGYVSYANIIFNFTIMSNQDAVWEPSLPFFVVVANNTSLGENKTDISVKNSKTTKNDVFQDWLPFLICSVAISTLLVLVMLKKRFCQEKSDQEIEIFSYKR